jgi:hypothetical protein
MRSAGIDNWSGGALFVGTSDTSSKKNQWEKISGRNTWGEISGRNKWEKISGER